MKPIMIGDEASEPPQIRSMLEIFYPLIEGVVVNWEQMEHIWNYSFYNKLGLKESDFASKRILLTEAAENPDHNRAKMAEIMFEKYGFGGVLFEYQALLTLMAEGN